MPRIVNAAQLPPTTVLPNDLITAAEACDLIPGRGPGRKLSRVSLFRRIGRGQLRAWRFGGPGGVVCVSRAELLGLFVPVCESQAEPRRAESRAELDRWNAEVMRRLG